MMPSVPRGTKDLYGKEIDLYTELENKIRILCDNFGFLEIRTPIFEYTELFIKATGETSDIVQKEMYTFNDRGGKSLTLKPEGTPGAVRAFIEHNLKDEITPTKLFYITPLFRCERPQAGRMRQFHQFGIELFGVYDFYADVEVLSMAHELFRRLQLNNIELRINSLGCKTCRQNYNDKLKSFLYENLDCLCELCKDRYEKNPLRILDCKNKKCQDVLTNSPVMLDSLDEECSNHFEGVKKGLEQLEIPFVVDSRIVRGLDYYSRTVFEFVSDDLGSQSTVCGGGRYDDLIEISGGKPTGAIGFGIGIERLIIILEKQMENITNFKRIDIFIGNIGKSGFYTSQKLAFDLRKQGFSVAYDILNRTVKSQLKYANKILAKYTVIIGEEELTTKKVKIKNMSTREEVEIYLELDKIVEFYTSRTLA